MGDAIQFFGWERSGAAVGGVADGGRLRGYLAPKLTSFDGDGKLIETIQPPPIPFHLIGPGDVTGLRPGAVTGTYPAPGATNVETTKCPYVELADADLPWRYTPEPSKDRELKPWLVLVVGTLEEVQLLPGNKVKLTKSVLVEHKLDRSARWAHVQQDATRRVARVLSERSQLETNKQYRAVLVPAFKVDGKPAWDGTEIEVRLDAWFSFSFRTTDTTEDFKSLAMKLDAIDPPAGLGVAPLAYQLQRGAVVIQPQTKARGALTTQPADDPLPPHVAQHLAALRSTARIRKDRMGRPIIRLPSYGEPWLDVTAPGAPLWTSLLNRDPRYRGFAGLGAWAGIEWQELIVDAATKKAGALRIAAQRIRQLTAGLAASRGLWTRRLPQEPAQRLLVFGPSLARIATERGTVLEQVTASDRPLPPALFSSAARRMLRPGTALHRLAAPNATDASALLGTINDCARSTLMAAIPAGLPHPDTLRGVLGPVVDELGGLRGEIEIDFSEALANEPGFVAPDEEHREERSASLTRSEFRALFAETEGRLRGFAGMWVTETHRPKRPCRPVDLDGLLSSLDEAISPMNDEPFVARRVLTTITDDQPLTPPELCFDFDLPAWRFLRDCAKNWLLPGMGAQDVNHKVIAVATNQSFVDAFLIGLNQQALAELRWRSIPMASRCTPLRRFWERVKKSDQDSFGEDIIGIEKWASHLPLGDSQHESDDAKGTELVLVFKTELFRRYPNTLVYLAPQAVGGWEGTPNFNQRISPIFQGIIERDLTFFGFDRPPSVLETHWLVIEEVPRGIRFYNNRPFCKGMVWPVEISITDGAAFAECAFANPVRVIIQGTLMIPPP